MSCVALILIKFDIKILEENKFIQSPVAILKLYRCYTMNKLVPTEESVINQCNNSISNSHFMNYYRSLMINHK